MGQKTSIDENAQTAQTAQSHFNDIVSWHRYECKIRIPSNSSSYLREIRIGRGVSWTMDGDTKTLGIPIKLPTEKYGHARSSSEMLTLKRGQDDVWEVTSHVSGIPEGLPAILNNDQYADATLPKGVTKRLEGAQSHKIVCCVQTKEKYHAGNAPHVLFTIVDQSQASADTDMKEQEWVPNSYRWEGSNCVINVPQDSHITSIRIGRCKRGVGNDSWIFEGGPNCLGIKLQLPNAWPVPEQQEGMLLERHETDKNSWRVTPRTNTSVYDYTTDRRFLQPENRYKIRYGHWLTLRVRTPYRVDGEHYCKLKFCIMDRPPSTTPAAIPHPKTDLKEKHAQPPTDL